MITNERHVIGWVKRDGKWYYYNDDEKSAVRDAVMISNELGRTAAVNFIGIIHVGSDRGTGKVSNDCRKIAGIFCRGKYL